MEETENKQTSENLTENTASNEVQTEVIPNLNIRKARKADVEYIKSFCVAGSSMADALHTVVKLAQRELEVVEKTIEVEKEKEVIKEVERPLTGTQFICELPIETALRARKARSFIIKDGKVKGENYPNELATIAINDFLNEYYSFAK